MKLLTLIALITLSNTVLANPNERPLVTDVLKEFKGNDFLPFGNKYAKRDIFNLDFEKEFGFKNRADRDSVRSDHRVDLEVLYQSGFFTDRLKDKWHYACGFRDMAGDGVRVFQVGGYLTAEDQERSANDYHFPGHRYFARGHVVLRKGNKIYLRLGWYMATLKAQHWTDEYADDLKEGEEWRLSEADFEIKILSSKGLPEKEIYIQGSLASNKSYKGPESLNATSWLINSDWTQPSIDERDGSCVINPHTVDKKTLKPITFSLD